MIIELSVLKEHGRKLDYTELERWGVVENALRDLVRDGEIVAYEYRGQGLLREGREVNRWIGWVV